MTDNHYDGEVHCATLTTDRHGIPNSVYSFNGTSDCIAIKDFHYGTDAGAFASEINQITFCAWFKTSANAYGYRVIIDFDYSDYWGLTLYDGVVGWQTHLKGSSNAQDTLTTPLSYNDGKWHLVCATFDGTSNSKKLFIDGDKVAEEALLSGSSIGGTGNTRYGFTGYGSEADAFNGDRDSNGAFQGQIDDVIIFDEVLPEASIKALSNN
ncbi:MAG: LamG domain-containing protein [Dissulfuribacterales bacterium]